MGAELKKDPKGTFCMVAMYDEQYQGEDVNKDLEMIKEEEQEDSSSSRSSSSSSLEIIDDAISPLSMSSQSNEALYDLSELMFNLPIKRVLPMEEDARDTAGEENSKPETRDEMLARHRKESSQLQNKEIELKKAAAKGSKAEQKAKKKQVEEEITKQSAKLKEKQAQELAKLGYCGKSSGDQDKGSLDSLVKAIAGVSVNSQADQKPSKSVKRREKRAQEEAAREQRIKDEQGSIVSDRMVEDEKLGEKLTPLGLTINEVKPDGHCLYRAVEDQLARLTPGGSSPHTFQQLREMVASYMRQHSSDFLPFFSSVEGESESCLVERFLSYCEEVESTAAWGGQLEIGALTHCLRKHIAIYSGSFPDVEMGKEYKSGEGDSSILLSYHRHAFGLGEHYNSVVPL